MFPEGRVHDPPGAAAARPPRQPGRPRRASRGRVSGSPPGDERSAGQQPATGPLRPALRPYRRRVEQKPSNRRRPKWLPSLHDPGPLRLWRIGYALAACFAAAVAMLAALWLAARALLHYPALPHSHVISVHDTVGVAQLVFASVAGLARLSPCLWPTGGSG